ncbi:MAG: adenylate/guanylate cyclase domain-containing protein, partial [Candidatus Tectomicrobia bacterium]
MDFYEILANVIHLLQREGRTSYRALKRQFDLDDEYLEDLKLEIVRVRQLAVDQDGEMLVWTGDPATPVSPFQPDPTSALPTTQEAQPTIAEPPPPLDAERRQLSVMFCDLADSTKLSGQLDPEDLLNRG